MQCDTRGPCHRFQALKDACTYGQVREEPLVEDYLRKIERFLLLDEITAIPSVLVSQASLWAL